MSLLNPDWIQQAASQSWLIAVSGGKDSVALLHVCVEAGFKNLIVCHINHQLRGEESDADEKLVRELSEQYQLPIFVKKTEVANIAQQENKSIELAAREVRHQAFSQATKEHQCSGILLAHHANDQAETVLFNLLRGSAGLKGMQSISEILSLNISLHRPILHAKRSDIDDYIGIHQLKYREDSSNTEPFATRNRMRNEVIPLLTEILGRDVSDTIVRSHHFAQQQDAFIEQQIDYAKILDPQGRIHLSALLEQPKFIQKKIIHHYLTEHKISNVTEALITSCLDLLDTSGPAKINLAKGRHLRRKEQRIFIEN